MKFKDIFGREIRLSREVWDHISIGDPREAISKEVGDDILIRVDPKTNEVFGITILNFEKRFEQTKTEIFPITAALIQAEAGI
jgi:uncharacterized protein YuzE